MSWTTVTSCPRLTRAWANRWTPTAFRQSCKADRTLSGNRIAVRSRGGFLIAARSPCATLPREGPALPRERHDRTAVGDPHSLPTHASLSAIPPRPVVRQKTPRQTEDRKRARGSRSRERRRLLPAGRPKPSASEGRTSAMAKEWNIAQNFVLEKTCPLYERCRALAIDAAV
jgi:hypothetical protein